MGTLYYGSSGQAIEVPDRLLTYLKVVIAVKLRRNESFTLTLKHGADAPGGRSMIWLQPAIPLRFVFEAEAPDELDRAILHALVQQSNSTSGITVDLAEEDGLSGLRELAGRQVGAGV